MTVGEAGANRGAETLDIEEVQFLFGTPDGPTFHYWGYVGLLRIAWALWFVIGPDGDVLQKYLEDEKEFQCVARRRGL